MLRAAGFEIIGERKRAWEYYLADRKFSVPELKLLIDAVQATGKIMIEGPSNVRKAYKEMLQKSLDSMN